MITFLLGFTLGIIVGVAGLVCIAIMYDNEEHLIFHADSYKVWEYAEVDQETLCQFTGLTDKSNKRIWENDIVNHNGEYALVKFGMYCSSFDYGSYNLGFYVDFPEETFYRKELGYWRRKVETSGNVFDNPELLQEEH